MIGTVLHSGMLIIFTTKAQSENMVLLQCQEVTRESKLRLTLATSEEFIGDNLGKEV